MVPQLPLPLFGFGESVLGTNPPAAPPPRGGSFLPCTSIAPGEQGTARRLLPEVSAERCIFHPNTEGRHVGKAKIFHGIGILFLCKILVQQKILKGINKSNTQASCSKPCSQPTTPCSILSLTDSGLYSFSITQSIPEPKPLLFNFKHKQRKPSF